MRRVRYLLLVMLVVVLAAVAGGYYWLHSGNPDALRKIVLQRCVPNQQQNQNPAPCAEVNLKGGYVLFKDHQWPAAISADADLPYQRHRKPAAT